MYKNRKTKRTQTKLNNSYKTALRTNNFQYAYLPSYDLLATNVLTIYQEKNKHQIKYSCQSLTHDTQNKNLGNIFNFPHSWTSNFNSFYFFQIIVCLYFSLSEFLCGLFYLCTLTWSLWWWWERWYLIKIIIIRETFYNKFCCLLK